MDTESSSVTQDQPPEIREENDEAVLLDHKENFSHTAQKLAEGLLDFYEPKLKKVQKSLQMVTKKQGCLIQQIQHESNRFTECEESFNIKEVFAQMKECHTKLAIIKKEMVQIQERTAKLKKRSFKIHQQKQKEALQREQQRDREREREEQLIAKPVKKS